MLVNLFEMVLFVSILTTIFIIVVFFLMPFIERRFTAKWRHWMWMIFTLRLLLPFQFNFSKAPIVLTIPDTQMNMGAVGSGQPSAGMLLSADMHTFTIIEIAAVIWCVGVVLFLTYYLTSYILYKKRIITWCSKEMKTEVLNTFNFLKIEMSIKGNIGIAICKKITSPIIVGLMHPVILLPHEHYDAKSLNVILKHELIHYRRKDIWFKLLLLICNAIHWFNPAIYLMNIKVSNDMEICCDAEVIKDKDISFKEHYSDVILSTMIAGRQDKVIFSTNFNTGKKTMKQRLSNILETKPKNNCVLWLLPIALLIVMASISVSFANLKADNAEISTSPNYSIKNVLVQLLPTQYSAGSPEGDGNALEMDINKLVEIQNGLQDDILLISDNIENVIVTFAMEMNPPSCSVAIFFRGTTTLTQAQFVDIKQLIHSRIDGIADADISVETFNDI